jgi:hypothetical protein
MNFLDSSMPGMLFLVIPGRSEAANPESITPIEVWRRERKVRFVAEYGFRVRAFGAPRSDSIT